MRGVAVLSLLPLAFAVPSAKTKREHPAPLIKPRDGALLVEGKYIVKMNGEMKPSVMSSSMKALSNPADHTYNSKAFHGFAGTLTDDELDGFRNDPDVEYVEHVIRMYAYASETQENADWGLARLSSDSPGTSSYTYDSSAGEGTCAYVVDTGIQVDHPEFEGRAKWLENFAGDNDDTDGQGHGTHVAGTIGSKTYGVAKKTKLFAVKVLDANGEGTNSGVIAGMDFVASDSQDCPNGVVVNMSLGGAYSRAVNEAAAAIVNAGYFLAVAAGNEETDASSSSPASEESVCTVGATDENDNLADYSNFGSLVDILAPGSQITSTWNDGSIETISGTSMASPHIAGVAAYFLGLGGAPTDPVELCSYIAQEALEGVIKGVPSDTVNLLAHIPGGNLNRTRRATRPGNWHRRNIRPAVIKPTAFKH